MSAHRLTLLSKLLLLLTFFLIGCQNAQRKLFIIQGSTMGTSYAVKIVKQAGDDSDEKYHRLSSGIEKVLGTVNQQMSTYIDDSEISLFNQHHSSDWFSVSADLATVVKHALRVGTLSGNAFDITVGPLVNLWGFGPENRPNRIPSDAEIYERMQSVGSFHLAVRLSPPAIKKDIPDLYCDLSAIAKGFGVDKVAEYLDLQKLDNYLIEIGGEIRAKGLSHTGREWRIGVSTPDQKVGVQKVVSISNCAIATSGDYWNYFEENGVRYSHTLDPKTGWPITHKLASVTVVHDSCVIADALATAIDVLGPDAGYDFATKESLPVFMIVKSGDGFVERMSPQFEKMLSAENRGK